jgi:hypothetical protein
MYEVVLLLEVLLFQLQKLKQLVIKLTIQMYGQHEHTKLKMLEQALDSK